MGGWGCRGPGAAQGRLQRFSYAELHMGTVFQLTLYAASEAAANQASELAFERIAQIDARLSDYHPRSELRLLEAHPAGQPLRVSEDLWEVVRSAQALARATGGAFDITVRPAVELWRQVRRTRRLPGCEEVERVLQRVDYRQVQLGIGGRSITLKRPGLRLDLGGIAKGYAADQALGVLRRSGIRRAMVAAGGDIAAGDPPPGRFGWRIGIDSLDAGSEGVQARVWLKNAAISTSGDTEQYVEIGGKRYSHIVDPRTGWGLERRTGVTVVGGKAIQTDSLATALSVLGPERGMEWIGGKRGVSARWVTMEADGVRCWRSAGYPAPGIPGESGDPAMDAQARKA